MIFDVKNNGSYAAYLNNATFTVAYTQGTGYATTQTTRTFNLYDAADPSSAIASTTVAASTTISTMSFAPLFYGAHTGGFEIAAGTTKTFLLTGDLSDCGVPTANPGSTIRFSISSGASTNWDDGVATAVQSIYTKNFPVYGTVVSF
jgi:hypothetical protein